MAQVKVKKSRIAAFAGNLREALGLFRKNDPLRMAGATAFFTTFALPPIVFILAQLFGLIIGPRDVGRGLIKNISNVLGEEGAGQVRQVIRSIRGFSDNWFVIVLGFIFLLFVATTLFNVIKNSLNQVWQVNVKEKPGLLFMLSIRIRSFAIIMLAGILFFADLLLESLKVIGGKYIDQVWEGSGIYFRGIMNEVASVIVVAAWFILLFRFLADAKPSWKASLAGGLLTAVLFTGGRWLLRYLLVNSNIGHLYGPSGSFVLVLLFVFYSSFILYYGACFIAVYSAKKKWPIKTNEKAFHYKIQKT